MKYYIYFRGLLSTYENFHQKQCLLLILISCSVSYLYLTLCNLYLLPFFCFLRLSNILPHTIKGFDYTRQLCRRDLIFSQDSIVIIIKWSKTIQNRRDTSTISVPSLGSSPLWKFQAALMIPCSRSQRMVPLFHLLILRPENI